MNQIPLEYWIYFQLGIDLGLIFLILFFLRYLKKTLSPPAMTEIKTQPSINTSSIDALESFMKSARDSAIEFESLVNEKKRLIAILDEKLESKKKGLTEIIKQAEAVSAELKKQASAAFINHKEQLDNPSAERTASPFSERSSFLKSRIPDSNSGLKPSDEMIDEYEAPPADKNESILELASRGLESHAISARLAIPIGEVELTLDLDRRMKSEILNNSH